MNLIDLPVEIVVGIIKKLDVKSVHNLYKTCKVLKYIICTNTVVTTCTLSFNTMATAQTFGLKFFEDISDRIKHLDLRGVNDLNKTALLKAVKRMICLKTLDVSYTNITINDIIHIYKICPTMKNLACNFMFDKKTGERIPEKVLIESQKMFQNFDNIHFVGNSNNLLNSELLLYILQKANLQHLRLTISEKELAYELIAKMENEIELNWKVISIFKLNMLQWNNKDRYGSLFDVFKIRDCEFIDIHENPGHKRIHASPVFQKFFYEQFGLETICEVDLPHNVYHEVIMIWNKSVTLFDDMFFSEFKNEIKDFFPINISKDTVTMPPYTNRFLACIPQDPFTPTTCIVPVIPSDTFGTKRRRTGPINHKINFDKISELDKIYLTLIFYNGRQNPVSVCPDALFLKKITYLSLEHNTMLSSDFFKIVFNECKQLETLDMKLSLFCVNRFLFPFIGLSNSLKNLRVLSYEFGYDNLFSCLSECRTLENVHIIQMKKHNTYLGDPSEFFQNCNNLYSIGIYAHMSSSVLRKYMAMFRKLKKIYNKNYLDITLCGQDTSHINSYNQFTEVFKLDKIKPKHIFF